MTQGLHVRAMRPSLLFLSHATPRHATPFLSPPSIIHHTYHSSPPCALCGTPPSIQHHGLNVPRCVVGSLSLANSNGSTPPLSQSPTHTTLPTPYYYAVHTTRVPPSCIIATTSNEITRYKLHCHETGVALEPCTPHCLSSLTPRHATPLLSPPSMGVPKSCRSGAVVSQFHSLLLVACHSVQPLDDAGLMTTLTLYV